MMRRRFIELGGKSVFLTTFQRKLKRIFGKLQLPFWPQSSYPNLPVVTTTVHPLPAVYAVAGVGGGGAYAGYAISPFNGLRLVGTDMGTLFRSPNSTKSWYPISHFEAEFSSNLDINSPIAFSPDGMVVLYAKAGASLQRSTDQCVTFTPVSLTLKQGEIIQYFTIDSYCVKLLFMGTNFDLYISQDQGITWQPAGVNYLSSVTNATGTFIDYASAGNPSRTIYHATGDHLYKLQEGGTWQSFALPAMVRIFTAGRDLNGLTLAFAGIDTYINPGGPQLTDAVNALAATISKNDDVNGAVYGKIDYTSAFGFIYNSTDGGKTFTQLQNMGCGTQLCMAENDAMTIYTTGGIGSATQQGSKVWRSKDRGLSWQLKFLEENQAGGYKPWPNLAYSAPGLDIAWFDDSFHNFSINPRNSGEIGGTNNFFLLTSIDAGDHWLSPFTQYAGTSATPQLQDRWRSTGMEDTSILRFKFQPGNPKLGYAAACDIAGLVTEDGGTTFRITQTSSRYMQYDYAFNPGNESVVYAAAGNIHDWPENKPFYFYSDGSISGGVFRSDDKGHTWARLTPYEDRSGGGPILPTHFNMQFISIAYDPSRKYIYAGSQGNGLAFSNNDGASGSWVYLNNGLPVQNQASPQSTPELIIAQIEIDPGNGNIYCLVAGNAPDYTNFNNTGIYMMKRADLMANPATASWLKLGNPNPSANGNKWYYPLGFAIDWTDQNRKTLWLIDADKKQPNQYLNTGIWKSPDGGQNWTLNQSFTNPRHICIDTRNAGTKIVYVNGGWEVTPKDAQNGQGGSDGFGGPLHSDDGGTTWWKNVQLPLLSNGQSTVPDPNDVNALFYTFFGGGLMHGPLPQKGENNQVK